MPWIREPQARIGAAVGLALTALLVGCSNNPDAVETVADTAAPPALPSITTTAAGQTSTSVAGPASTLVPSELGELAATFDDPTEPAIALGSDGLLVYVLGPVELDGRIVADASVDNNSQWFVVVELTPEGSEAFDALAAEVIGSQLAVVLDGVVLSAPTVSASEFGGQLTVTGAFSGEDAAAIRDSVLAARDAPERFGLRRVHFAAAIPGLDVADLLAALEEAR